MQKLYYICKKNICEKGRKKREGIFKSNKNKRNARIIIKNVLNVVYIHIQKYGTK